MDIAEELRNKKSRDNRDLLDRAANEINALRLKLNALTVSSTGFYAADKSVVLLKPNGSLVCLYEFVETIEQCELLAQLAMSRKSSQDLVVILPGTNRGIHQYHKDAYERALQLEKIYMKNAEKY